MKKVFIAMALLVLLLALPFRSMIVEAVTARTERIEVMKRGITMEQYAVAPVDIFKSKHLKRVKQQRPTSSHGKVILHSFMYPRTSSSIARNAWLYICFY